MNRLRPARVEDCFPLSTSLRHDDLQEVLAAPEAWQDPLLAIRTGFDLSASPVTLECQGQVAGMAGVVPDTNHPGFGNAWMLGADILSRHRAWYLRETFRWIESEKSVYDTLYTVCSREYKSAVRWLERLGFVAVGEVQGCPPQRTPFLVMAMEVVRGRSARRD